MRKKFRIAENEGDCPWQDPNDFISQMPDDILVSFLSRLPLKEAVNTSNISTRWRYLWCEIDDLDFDANESLNKVAADPKLRVVERPKYINWVNRVTREHKAPTINDFRICFDLDKSSKTTIDEWIEFAISKRVHKVELDLLENGEKLRHPAKNYVFPIECLDTSLGSSVKQSPSCKAMELKCLKSLSLKCVNMTEECLEKLLTNCTALELLSIHASGELVNVKIGGHSLVLKNLEIVFCVGVKTIELFNFNLVSFNYLGSGISLKLSNLPMLEEISMGEGYSGFENNIFGQISCCVSYLQILTLDVYRPEKSLENIAFPEFPKLKQLILKLGAWEDDSLLEYTSFAKKAPNLHRFVIQLIWMSPAKRRRKIRQAPNHKHKNLKMVELVGYYGRTTDVELAVYFIENAIALKKLVIDPRYQVLERTPKSNEQLMMEKTARTCAIQQLPPRTPRGVELIIL